MFSRAMMTVATVAVAAVCVTMTMAQDVELTETLGAIQAAIKANDLKSAESLVRKARDAGVEKRHLARPKAGILLQRGKAEDARSLLALHLRNEPEDIASRALLCAALVQLRDAVELEQQVRQMAVQSRRASFMTLLSQGQLAMLRGEWQKARASFLQARQVLPGSSAQTMRWILQADLALGDTFAARDHAEEALEANAADPLANYVMGSLAVQRGEYETGVRYLEKSATIAASPATMNDLAWALYKLGRLDEAEKMARQLLDKQPEMHATLDTLGMIVLQKGKAVEAEQLFRKALKINHENVSLFVHLAMALQQRGELEEAREIVKPLLARQAELGPGEVTELRKLAMALGITVPAGE